MVKGALQITDTIVAEATPRGTGPISIVRVSGKDTFRIINFAFGLDIEKNQERLLCELHHDGVVIDRSLIQLYGSPFSYTGEDMAEIGCHGNPLIVQRVIQLLVESGARLANPGEYTFRAFMNGKMSIDQAESVSGMIESGNMVDLHRAAEIHSGKATKFGSIELIISKLTTIVANIEALIDFPDDLEEPSVNISDQIQDAYDLLLKLGDRVSMQAKVPRIVIVGNRNAGKSTLFNALVGWPRAIVDDHPGTTRDYLEEEVVISGMPVRLVDTAGYDSELTVVEKLGVDISLDLIKEADLVVVVNSVDSSVEYLPILPLKDSVENEQKIIRVMNKIDLNPDCILKNSGDVPLSAFTGYGMDKLYQKLVSELSIKSNVDMLWISSRQFDLVQRAINHMREIVPRDSHDVDLAVVGYKLKHVLSTVRDVIPEKTNTDVVRKIFETFCVGK